jgi:predicted TIM-barrel fold metal-dependent hydrolase
MEITDAQVHVWPPQADEAPWDQESRSYVAAAGRVSSAHRGSFGASELLAEMERAGVSHAVLVPPVFAGDSNDTALAAAADYPGRFAVMGRLTLPDRDAGLLRSWLAQPGMAGVRLTFFYERHRQWLFDGTADWVWPVLAELGIPTAVFAPGLTPDIGVIAERHPGLRLVIDHFGIPQQARDDEIRPFVDQLVRLARLPNVQVKASALPGYVTGPFPFTVLHREIERVVDSFGPRRVFWGSEMTRLPQPYRQCVELFTRALDFLPEQDLELIMGRAFLEWLGWDPP